eukprot:scaffold30096_cov69-Phaeocystis_antarctica.AAC.5
MACTPTVGSRLNISWPHMSGTNMISPACCMQRRDAASARQIERSVLSTSFRSSDSSVERVTLCPLSSCLYVGHTRPVWPASQNISANWPRLAEAGGRPELDLALAGRAGGRMAEAPGRLVST